MRNNYQINKTFLLFLTAFFAGAWRLGFYSIHHWKQFRFCYHKLMGWNENFVRICGMYGLHWFVTVLTVGRCIPSFQSAESSDRDNSRNCNQPANYKHVMTKLISVEKVRIKFLTFMIRSKSSIDLNENNPHLSRHPARISRICLATSAHLEGLGLKRYVPLTGSMRLWEMTTAEKSSFDLLLNIASR